MGKHNQGRKARVLRPWLLRLKAKLKNDPDEKAYKRRTAGYVLNRHVAEVAHQTFVDTSATEMKAKGWSEIPSPQLMENLLSRGSKVRTK